MASSMQTSPMSDVKQPWDFARLDQQILNDKVKSTKGATARLQKQQADPTMNRSGLKPSKACQVHSGKRRQRTPRFPLRRRCVAHNRDPCDTDFKSEHPAQAGSKKIPDTRDGPRRKADIHETKQVVHRVEAENISPFVMDRIVDFWLQYRLDVGHVKTVSRATQMPVDTADIDVSTTQSDLDVLMDILAAAHELEDEALIDLALACVRYRVRHTLLAAKEWVEVIRRAYEMTTVKKEHDRLQKRILLNAGLYYRSPLQLPCLAKDIFKAALKARADLQDDWNHTLGWYDTTGSRQC